jgi:hypothetical protein
MADILGIVAVTASALMIPFVVWVARGTEYRLLRWSLILYPGAATVYASMSYLLLRLFPSGPMEGAAHALMAMAVVAYIAHLVLLFTFLIKRGKQTMA